MLICAAVSGADAWTSHPLRLRAMWYLRTACSVMTVFGAEVPLGRPPVVWMTGPARQPWLGVHAGLLPPPGPGPGPETLHDRNMRGRPARPDRMVRMSLAGCIWLPSMPYVASSWGVATYKVPVK